MKLIQQLLRYTISPKGGGATPTFDIASLDTFG